MGAGLGGPFYQLVSPADANPSTNPRGEYQNDPRQALVQRMIEEAVVYIDGAVSPDRVKATDYYRGMPYGTEQEGRSQFISTDVRDTVHGMLPSLLDIF